jgi:tetratricopeptide (TPR) repeat protein
VLKMRRFKISLMIFTICFVFISPYQLIGQNTAAIDKQKILEEKLDAINSNLKIIINQYSNNKLTEKIEDIAEDIYERRHSWLDKILLNGQWLVTVLIGLIALISIISTYVSYRYVKDKANGEIKSIQEASQKALESLEDRFEKVVTKETEKAKEEIKSLQEASQKALKSLEDRFEKVVTKEMEKAKEEIKSLQEASQKELEFLEDRIGKGVAKVTKEARAKTYYDLAVSLEDDEKFDVALTFLKPLYKSNNYRLRDVCFHMGTCYKYLNEPQQALKFFEEAKNIAEEKGKDILVKTIQKEIDEVRGKFKDSHS